MSFIRHHDLGIGDRSRQRIAVTGGEGPEVMPELMGAAAQFEASASRARLAEHLEHEVGNP